MSIFTKNNLLFLRDPQGGVEDVQLMKESGFNIVACNVQKEITPDKWDLVRQRAEAADVMVVPWCYIWNLDDADRLVDIHDSWDAPGILFNPEKQLDQGVFTCKDLEERCIGKDAAFSTECWLYGGVDWSPILEYPMMLQIFPYEVPTAWKWDDCRKHAYEIGFDCVMFTFGVYDVDGVGQPQPSDYPLQAPYQLYTADDMTYCYPDYYVWSPTGYFNPCQEDQPLPPLSEEEFPFTGPYYPLVTKRKPNRGKTVKALKIMMERLKFGKFPDPTNVFGVQLRDALYKYQQSVKIAPPTGNYGMKTWNALLSAITDTGEYAANEECLQLIQEDHLAQEK